VEGRAVKIRATKATSPAHPASMCGMLQAESVTYGNVAAPAGAAGPAAAVFDDAVIADGVALYAEVVLRRIACGGRGVTVRSTLERIILASAPFVDVSTWRAQLGELEAQVCRVEVPARLASTVGTGFLVGPDVCLTNFHVVKILIDHMADPRQARLRFDRSGSPAAGRRG
jgi:hypothetical protein